MSYYMRSLFKLRRLYLLF